MHRLTKSQLRRRKKKRWAMKPIRQYWKLRMKEVMSYAT